MKILKIRHTGIVVEDLEAAEAYYATLGLTPYSRGTEFWDGKQLLISKLVNREGGGIELIQGDWFNHICVEVDELDPGAMFLYKNFDHYEVGFFRDPEGNVIEVYCSKH